MKTVLFGASRGMGRALARLMAARGDRLFLLEHVAEELEFSARDLEIHGAPEPVGTAYCDLLQPATFATALDQAERELGGFDTVVVTAGLFATQDELENDPSWPPGCWRPISPTRCSFARKPANGSLSAEQVGGHALRLQFRGRRARAESRSSSTERRRRGFHGISKA